MDMKMRCVVGCMVVLLGVSAMAGNVCTWMVIVK